MELVKTIGCIRTNMECECENCLYILLLIKFLSLDTMDSNSEDGDYQHREGHHDAAQYRVSYPRERNTTDVSLATRYKTQIYLCMMDLF